MNGLRGSPLLSSPDEPGPSPNLVRRRTASLNLRESGSQGAQDSAELLDPANQSLADALRITLRLLQFAMVVIFGLYVLSGFQSVKENERATRLVFGKPNGEGLEPGFRFSYPYPVGELVKIDIGQASLNLTDEFWVFLADQKAREMPLEQLSAPASLTPGQGGANLTADGNIAHTRWKVLYTRANSGQFARNVLPEHAERIVKAAVMRGVVHATARVTIDDLLKQSTDDTGSVAGRARAIAQAMLDNLQSGIKIDRLLLENRTPPLFVLRQFNNVQGAAATAQAARENANAEARKVLNAKAGEAVPYLVRAINDYELALAAGDEAKQVATLDTINKLLDGTPVQIGERTLENLASGQVAKIISEARQYRSSVVSQRRTELATFQAKLQQFKSNPALLVTTEWADGLNAFLSRENVEVFTLPPGIASSEVWLSRDPDISRDIEQKIREAQVADRKRRREAELFGERFRTKETQGQPMTR